MLSPDGNIVTIQQISPDSSGNYSATVKAGGTMNSSGEYEIRAQYGAQKITSTFSFISGDAPDKSTPEPMATPTPEPMATPTPEPMAEPTPEPMADSNTRTYCRTNTRTCSSTSSKLWTWN